MDETVGDRLAGRASYWDLVYGSSRDTRLVPSQFAAFVAGEVEGQCRIVDVGCGSGRDALFFAELGHDVVGVDASYMAVETCRRAASDRGVSAEFLCSSISDRSVGGRIPATDLPCVVYARFFLHALTDAEEVAFLDLAAALTRPGDMLATEYRTVRDSSSEKATGEHFRRFITPATFQANAMAHGFDLEYSVEGLGHAKYRAEDAYVAREIFVRRVPEIRSPKTPS